VIFFFDRCVPKRLARMLDAYDANHQIVHQDDDARFEPETTDVELFQRLGRDDPRPVFVTADPAQRRHRNERVALGESGLTVVFFGRGWNHRDFHTRAWQLLRIWPDIVQAVQRVREPGAFEITASGRKVQRLGPTRSLSGK